MTDRSWCAAPTWTGWPCSADDNSDGLAVAVDSGRIAAIGSNEAVVTEYPVSTFEHACWTCGQVLLPGLVDGHTHPSGPATGWTSSP